MITSTKQIKPSVLKSLQGKAGKAGANGAQGAAGAIGPQGPAGGTGPAGAVGAKGETGATGPQGEKGATGTNGKDGTTGFTETLPSGKTEEGEWSVTPVEIPELGHAIVGHGAISFVIPLQAAPTLVYLKEGEGKTVECPGTAAEPKAEKGFLCLYTVEENEQHLSGSTASAFGAQLIFGGEFAGLPTGGSWAVTAG